MARLAHSVDLAPGGGGEGVGWPPWANANLPQRPKSKKDFVRRFESGAIKRVPAKRISWTLERLRTLALAGCGLELC